MTISNSLKENINEKFVLQLNTREIELQELKKQYSLRIRVPEGNTELLLIKNLEDLKQNYLSYTKGNFMPKDCDFILIREHKKEIYFIELKSVQQKKFKYRKTDIQEQLVSGEMWLRHMFFCSSSVYDDIDKYKKYYVAINKTRQKQALKRCLSDWTVEENGRKFTFWNGESFNLSEFK